MINTNTIIIDNRCLHFQSKHKKGDKIMTKIRQKYDYISNRLNKVMNIQYIQYIVNMNLFL